MSEKRVLEILESCDALQEGHFRYTSGKHGSRYFEKIRIVSRPHLVDELGRMMAVTMDDVRDGIDLVCSPAFGALVFGFATALHMGKNFAFLQRNADGGMTVRSGFREMLPGNRILLVEDVSTTGGSIKESIETLHAHDARVVQVGILVDRTGGELELGVPYRALLTVKAESWKADDCPLCRQGIPISVPGSSGKKL